MTDKAVHPPVITASCLCKAVTFEVSFPGSTSWPPPSATCQCTMCRKWTASLVASFIVVQPEQITPALSTFSTYTEYESSPRRLRGFCSRCGSSLIWRSEDNTATWDLYLGCVDQEWLVGGWPGRGTDGGSVDDYERAGGSVGQDLCTPNQFQFWWENVIPGVTDHVKTGERHWRENDNSERVP